MKFTISTTSTTILTLSAIQGSHAFAPSSMHSRPSTNLFLEDKIADMIDMELLRLTNKKEYDKQLTAQTNQVLEEHIPEDFSINTSTFTELGADADAIELRRDVRMIERNPQKYCADRCVSTGHCEVLEDMFHLDASEVVKFCTDCVLSEEEEPCDIPQEMLDAELPNYLSLKP